MAQTVAIQRGTGSFTGNSSVTLFTQSGGLATRVISCSFTYYSTASTNKYISLAVSASGGPIYPVGYMFTQNASGALMPSLNPFDPSNNSTNPALRVTLSTSSTSAYPAADPAGISVATATSGGQMYQNFWMGPSDVLRIYHNVAASTVTYGYQFVTVTES